MRPQLRKSQTQAPETPRTGQIGGSRGFMHNAHIMSNICQSCHYIYIYMLYVYILIYYMLYLHIIISYYTSSTAQGGGGSFKNRKPIGEVGCCESGMAERIH